MASETDTERFCVDGGQLGRFPTPGELMHSGSGSEMGDYRGRRRGS